MKVKLMTLPDFPRGGAWPSSVRTVRRSVKSDNERDPHPYSPAYSSEWRHYRGTAVAKAEEGAVNGRSVCPESPGLHARYKGQDNGHRHRKVEQSRNLFVVRIEGCNSPS